MNTAETSHWYIFKLKKLIQQIRLPWSSYAALGTILGAYISNMPLVTNLGLLFLLTIIIVNKKNILNQNVNLISTAVFTSCMLITAGTNHYQTQKLFKFYENYAHQRFTLYGEIVAIDSLALNPKQRCVKILVNQIAPIVSSSLLPKFVTLWVSNTNQLQLYDQILISNLEIPRNNNLTTLKKNLLEQAAQVRLSSDSNYKILTKLPNKLTYNTVINFVFQKIYKFKHQFLLKLKFKLSPATFSLLTTIFLGHKKAGIHADTQQMRNQFQVWGLAHFLARAGLHMIIIALLIKLLLLGLQIPTRLNSPTIILLILLYHQLSWPSISFLRALYMVTLYEFCKFNNWQLDGLHLLNLILVGALLINPVQIFSLDFQLSFALTYALVLAFRQNQYQIIAFKSPTII